ncbi:MAG: NAD(P)-dependent alcohol dehydrogenase [Moraxellaceae bacterium]|nr:NAD(P)-dependent alcohol dehydrogenase [Pseudobdellovibrionaceae bacterium]
MVQALGYATKSAKGKLKPLEFKRKDPAGNEVQISVKYCGVCHSDVHQARNEWSNTNYPCMPGHEIIGVVEKKGAKVKNLKVGELVGVGCMIKSCQNCESCKEGLEQYCTKGATATYNGNIREPKKSKNTFGGYSDKIVVSEDFVLKIPKKLAPESVAPILCAGVTTYSPLRYWKIGPGHKVAIVGFGGLGNMGVKIAKAMGAEVTVVTAHKEKMADAKKIGNAAILSTDKKAMKKAASSFDFILSTIPQPHDANPFIALLKRDGVLTIVGCIAPLSKPLDLGPMIMDRRVLASSLIGSIAETQEVLDFCAKHNILPDTKLIEIDEINKAFDDLDKGEVNYRYVIDMSSLAGQHENKPLLKKIGITQSFEQKFY